MTITAPSQPGRYMLKFDLVSEGIDWFEALRVADDDEDSGGDLKVRPLKAEPPPRAARFGGAGAAKAASTD